MRSAAMIWPALTLYMAVPYTPADPSCGPMAEWLCRGLQILLCRFDSGSGLKFAKYIKYVTLGDSLQSSSRFFRFFGGSESPAPRADSETPPPRRPSAPPGPIL